MTRTIFGDYLVYLPQALSAYLVVWVATRFIAPATQLSGNEKIGRQVAHFIVVTTALVIPVAYASSLLRGSAETAAWFVIGICSWLVSYGIVCCCVMLVCLHGRNLYRRRAWHVGLASIGFLLFGIVAALVILDTSNIRPMIVAGIGLVLLTLSAAMVPPKSAPPKGLPA
ncbi:hypothetical protein EF294_03140 [Gordonia oryzae]|uniref:Uncharacterized protein n=1 Tax=Gordonia oryzae TaxID=2487349 RepID=A0A3N4GWD9_9ACTN|nr:hypothetical protein EF294_03140 [Gordonia oryzae]